MRVRVNQIVMIVVKRRKRRRKIKRKNIKRRKKNNPLKIKIPAKIVLNLMTQAHLQT